MVRKFTLVTGHGKLDFIMKDNGLLQVESVNGKSLSRQMNKAEGKLGTSKEVTKPTTGA